MIYFLRQGKDGPVKIGRSVNPQARIRSLQTGSPEPLLVLAFAPGDSHRESEIHRRLEPHRIKREWYHPAPDVFALIAEIQTPEFIVDNARAYAVLRRSTVSAPTRPCPFCGKPHTHGEGDGHRVAHCADDAQEVKSEGITLRRADGYWVLTDEAT